MLAAHRVLRWRPCAALSRATISSRSVYNYRAAKPQLTMQALRRRNDVESAMDLFEAHTSIHLSEPQLGSPLPCEWYNALLSILHANSRWGDEARVRSHMRERGILPNETTVHTPARAAHIDRPTPRRRPLPQVTLEMRSLVARGELGAAHDCLRNAEASGVPMRLRTYRPLLDALVEQSNTEWVWELLLQIRSGGLEPGEAELVPAAALFAGAGRGAFLEATLRWLQVTVRQVQLPHLHLLKAGLDQTASGRHARWAVVDASGRCDGCGAQLSELPLQEAEAAEMVSELERAAASRGDGLGDDLARFKEWVRELRFSHVIDGANVAYKNQNIGDGHFSFRQAEWGVSWGGGVALGRWRGVGAVMWRWGGRVALGWRRGRMKMGRDWVGISEIGWGRVGSDGIAWDRCYL